MENVIVNITTIDELEEYIKTITNEENKNNTYKFMIDKDKINIYVRDKTRSNFVLTLLNILDLKDCAENSELLTECLQNKDISEWNIGSTFEKCLFNDYLRNTEKLYFKLDSKQRITLLNFVQNKKIGKKAIYTCIPLNSFNEGVWGLTNSEIIKILTKYEVQRI